MSYLIRRCNRCNTANERTMEYCAKCGATLPVDIVASDLPPMAPPAYAMKPDLPIGSQRVGIAPDTPIACRIVDVSIPFMSMVTLLVKVAVAAIPALAVLTIYTVMAYAVLATLFHGMRGY